MENHTFAVYARIHITEAPPWIPSFMQKYQKQEPHVTLKQTCYISADELPAALLKARDFFQNYHMSGRSIPVTFSRVRTQPEWSLIMIDAEENSELSSLQRALVEALSQYRKNYVEPELPQYENNFVPHLTVADEIEEGERARVSSEFPKECIVKAEIKEIIFSVDGSSREVFPL